MRPARGARAGFTLAEVAVTLLIVAIGLTLIIQGLTTAKQSAADSYYRKLSRELALLTLGQVEAGLFWEDLDGVGGDVLTGTYAEEGHEEVHYELVLGDEQFAEVEPGRDGRDSAYHDNWRHERERRERLEDDDEDDDELTEPYEKVRIKVSYPRFGERQSTVVLERWIPWEQVYGSDDEEADARTSAAGEEGAEG